MKDKFRISTSFSKYLLLSCLSMIVFTTLGCRRTLDAVLDEEDKIGDYCQAVINGPNTTVFFENDSITFSAYRESWYKRNNAEQRPALTGVGWESDIDGIISSQNYPDWKFSANHSFIRSGLTPGKHIIICTAGNSYGFYCSDTIYIEILPENQIEYLYFSFTLDEAETKTTFSTGAESYGKRIRLGLTSKCGISTLIDNVYTTIFNGNNFDWCNSITGNLIVSFIDEPKSVNVHAEWSVIGGDWTGNYAVNYEGIPYVGHPGSNSDIYF